MGDVCYRLQRVPHRASGIGQAGYLANRWIAPFSPRDERVACVASGTARTARHRYRSASGAECKAHLRAAQPSACAKKKPSVRLD